MATTSLAEGLAERFKREGLSGALSLLAGLMEADAGRRTANKTPNWASVPKQPLLDMAAAMRGLADSPEVKALAPIVSDDTPPDALDVTDAPDVDVRVCTTGFLPDAAFVDDDTARAIADAPPAGDDFVPLAGERIPESATIDVPAGGRIRASDLGGALTEAAEAWEPIGPEEMADIFARLVDAPGLPDEFCTDPAVADSISPESAPKA